MLKASTAKTFNWTVFYLALGDYSKFLTIISTGLQGKIVQIVRNVFVLKNKNQTVEFHALGSVSFKILI